MDVSNASEVLDMLRARDNFFHTIELLRVCLLDHFVGLKQAIAQALSSLPVCPVGKRRAIRFTVLRFFFYVNRLNFVLHLLFLSTLSNVSMPLASCF